MQSRRPLVIDLNNLFKPALKNGLDALSAFEKPFSEIHLATKTLKQLGHLPYAKLPSDDILRQNVQIMADRYLDIEAVVVFGIGGSALGAASIYQSLYGVHANLNPNKKTPKLFVIDYIDPDAMEDVWSIISQKRNLYVFISKSGNTSETLAQYLWLTQKNVELTVENCFIITDANKGLLRDMALKNDFPCLPIPSGVGGRFSVFTSVGLFPLAVSGVNIRDLLDGAQHMEQMCRNDVLAQNPAGLLAVTIHQWMQMGVSQIVMLPYADRLRLFTDWFAQLWAESLGKAKSLQGDEVYTGCTPIKSVGVTDQHSQLQLYLEGPKDKLVVFLEIEQFLSKGELGNASFKDDRIQFLEKGSITQLQTAERMATEECLREKDRPNLLINISEINEFQIGQLYQLFMNVIPYMGALMNINPYDQPAVERIKKFTYGLMGRKGFEDFASKLKSNSKNQGLIF